MKVSLASALGTCFGVEDAITMAMTPEFGKNLTIVGQLVHNPQINESLKNNGVSLVNNIDNNGFRQDRGSSREELEAQDRTGIYPRDSRY